MTCNRLALVLTCYNRRDVTLACLGAIERQGFLQGVELRVFLLDDGSVDGSYDAIQSVYPSVVLMRGDGRCYWNGGMRLAYQRAREWGADAYLWLNDDVDLFSDAIARALACCRGEQSVPAQGLILVGSTRDSAGVTTYGGYSRCSRLNPLKLELLEPLAQCRLCDTFNGNFVLVTEAAAAMLGNLESGFTHASGDTDYGLRATAKGISCLVMPGHVGVCERNDVAGSWRDINLPIGQRWSLMLSPKGLPVKDWGILTRRHGGRAWPLLFVYPYVKFWIAGASRQLPGRGFRHVRRALSRRRIMGGW